MLETSFVISNIFLFIYNLETNNGLTCIGKNCLKSCL